MKLFLIIFLILTVFVSVTRGDDPSFSIKLNHPRPVQFCASPVLVADSLTIDVVGMPNIQGMKVSFTGGYIAGEDELVYSGSLTQSMPSPGTLLLTGSNNIQDYIDAIKTITYKNSKAIPTLGNRKITISLSDVDYLPETQHFYRYVSNPGISWSQAKVDAEAMSYYGLKGYLATITSKVENDFITSKTKGVGYIGASDAAVEGVWRWVTGPEASEDGSGRLFWNGTGDNYANGVPGTGPYLGRYNNWQTKNSMQNLNEPNNGGQIASNENYGHITVFPGDALNSYKWNDVVNTGGTGPWYPQGYIVEFGGMENTVLNLTATLDLQINTMLFKKGIIPAICEGDSIMLNQADTTKATYSWSHSESLSSATVANPVAKPLITTNYIVSGFRGTCPAVKDTFTVPVNPKPIVHLGNDTTLCNPATIVLNAGSFSKWQWSPNSESTQTIPVTKDGNYSVIVTDGNQCKGGGTIKVSFTNNPKMDFSSLDTLFCGVKSVLLNIQTNKGTFTLNRLSDNTIFNDLNINVPKYGSYLFNVIATDQSMCHSDSTINIGFHQIPTVSFDFDSVSCKGYNLPARYQGTADTIVSNFKWVFGGKVIADTIGRNFLVVPLGINRSQRDLKLIVTLDGCSDSTTLQNIKVTPKLSFKVLNNIGCEPFTADFLASNTEKVNYLWNFGDNFGDIQGDSIISKTYLNAGFYDVKLKVTTIVSSGEGCSNEVKIDSMVHVAPIPDVAFSLSPDSCLNLGLNQISYVGLIGTDKDSYSWNLKNFDQSEIITNPGVTKGPFGFNLKTKPLTKLWLQVISEFECKSVIDSIQLKRKTDFLISADATAGCIPFAPNLSGIKNASDLKDIIDFTWDFGDGTIGTGSPLSHTYNTPDTIYSVTLTGKSSVTECSNVLTKPDFLKTYPKPKADFTMDNKIVYNDKPDVKFTDNSIGAAEYNWDFGDGTSSTQPNLTHHFLKTGHLTVLLEVTNSDQCTDTVTQKLLVAFDHLFPPNGFSPNAPNKVDREFLLNSDGITPEGYHFTVLSRWNDIVFEAKDEIKGWDGRMNNGALAPAGVYVWILNYTDFLGRRHQQTGTVTLVY